MNSKFKDKGAIYNEWEMFIRPVAWYGLWPQSSERSAGEVLGNILYNRKRDLRAAAREPGWRSEGNSERTCWEIWTGCHDNGWIPWRNQWQSKDSKPDRDNGRRYSCKSCIW